MTYLGIDRGDGRTPEQKAAAENIEIAFSIRGTPAVFRCRECSGKNEWEVFVKHRPGCKTGKVLEGKCEK